MEMSIDVCILYVLLYMTNHMTCSATMVSLFRSGGIQSSQHGLPGSGASTGRLCCSGSTAEGDLPDH